MNQRPRIGSLANLDERDVVTPMRLDDVPRWRSSDSDVDGVVSAEANLAKVLVSGECDGSIDVDLSRLAGEPQAWLAHTLLAQAASQVAMRTIAPSDVVITCDHADGLGSQRLHRRSDAVAVGELLCASLVHVRVPPPAVSTSSSLVQQEQQHLIMALTASALDWDDDDASELSSGIISRYAHEYPAERFAL